MLHNRLNGSLRKPVREEDWGGGQEKKKVIFVEACTGEKSCHRVIGGEDVPVWDWKGNLGLGVESSLHSVARRHGRKRRCSLAVFQRSAIKNRPQRGAFSHSSGNRKDGAERTKGMYRATILTICQGNIGVSRNQRTFPLTQAELSGKRGQTGDRRPCRLLKTLQGRRKVTQEAVGLN